MSLLLPQKELLLLVFLFLHISLWKTDIRSLDFSVSPAERSLKEVNTGNLPGTLMVEMAQDSKVVDGIAVLPFTPSGSPTLYGCSDGSAVAGERTWAWKCLWALPESWRRKEEVQKIKGGEPGRGMR